REPPGLDDKILAGWNGLMLASLAEAARIFGRSDYKDAALRAAEFLRDHLLIEGRPRRTYKAGQARINGYLEDYAALSEAFLQVYQLTFDESWFVLARSLVDHALTHFAAPDGGFFDTSDDHEALIARPRSLEDNAIPSGTSLLCKSMALLSAYTGDEKYDAAARSALRQLTAAMREYPQAFGEALGVIDALVNGVDEVALVGDPNAPEMRALLDYLISAYRPNMVIALSPSDVNDEAAIPL
ncbi:MAG: thioredoxin domain-containing protein, partial [Phototrophicales bacterium]